ncbi:hypothetical protein FCM35_KLT17339 [Carex littledalei]|uniref:Uncharacterized protein n=1 Tax=Carex littledalei TaxID=544730 RepID=A0A833VG37_9POAL|nr:hypothetical protein FCM35_KLT17339 [Carex littledalei]
MAEISVNDHTVDIHELASHAQERLRSYRTDKHQHGKKQLICRVPKKFHEIDGSDYVPRRWSIGPYHNGDEYLQSMEMHKLNCLANICKHFPAATIQQYYEKLLPLEEEARRYYSGDIPMNTPSFLEMLLLDSCFILASFGILDPYIPADPILNSSNTGSNSMRNNGENHGAQNSNQSNPGFVGEEHSDQYNLRGSRARSDEINPADSSRDCYNTGSNHKENNEENRGAQNPNGSSHGFVGEENSEQNNIQISQARSNEISPADSIHGSSNTGSNSQEIIGKILVPKILMELTMGLQVMKIQIKTTSRLLV